MTSALPQPSPTKPWLPLRHVIGLIAVGIFIVGSLVGGNLLIQRGWTAMAQDHAELEEQYGVDMYAEMSAAMRSGDREAFIAWGQGDGQVQLARIWDETKKIGWTTGASQRGVSERQEEGDVSTDADYLHLAFDLGFTQVRAGENAGILTQVFDYEIEIVGDTPREERIVSLTARTPMPWDDEGGVAVVRRDNLALFGYADEAAALEAAADDFQTAAAGVLTTDLAQQESAEITGFAAFLSADESRYHAGLYGEQESPRAWEEAAATRIFAGSVDENAEKAGLYAGLGSGGSLAMFRPAALEDPLRTAAHEFAHVLHEVHIGGDPQLIASPESARSAGYEGFAQYTEDYVASPHDGVHRTLAPAVRRAILDAPTLDSLASPEAFADPATVGMAYDVSGNYFAFMADQGVSIPALLERADFETFSFDLWVRGNVGPNGEDLDDVAWRAWNAR